jgi:hypothetical protein
MNASAATSLLPVPGPYLLLREESYGEAGRFYDNGRHQNGIVYIGYEPDRVKRIYGATGKTAPEAHPSGRLLDIYV